MCEPVTSTSKYHHFVISIDGSDEDDNANGNGLNQDDQVIDEYTAPNIVTHDEPKNKDNQHLQDIDERITNQQPITTELHEKNYQDKNETVTNKGIVEDNNAAGENHNQQKKDDIEITFENDYSKTECDGIIRQYENQDYEDDDEAEYCMIIESLTNKFEKQRTRQISDDVTFLEENNLEEENYQNYEIVDIVDDDDDQDNNTNINEKKTNNVDDDQEDCIILEEKIENPMTCSLINMITSNKPEPNKEINQTHSLSKKLISSQPSFIPLSTSKIIENNKTEETKKNQTKVMSTLSTDDYSIGISTFSEFADIVTSIKNNKIPRVSSSSSSQSDSQESSTNLESDNESPRPSTSRERSFNMQNVFSLSDDISTLANMLRLSKPVIQSVLSLINDQCTIPFIVRYRQSHISGLNSDQVREITIAYNELKNGRKRAKEVEKLLIKQGKFDSKLRVPLRRCKNVHQVEQLYRLCCNESQDCSRAKNYGLGQSAYNILQGRAYNPLKFVNEFAIGLETINSVRKGWESIIVDIISKDCDILDLLIQSCKEYVPIMEIEINPETCIELRENNNCELIIKYKRFDKFKKRIDKINSHCLMAIERGEKLDILIVYIEFDDTIYTKLVEYCTKTKWPLASPPLLINCVKKAWINYLKPSIAAYIRYDLRNTAHLNALDVFRTNVKQLLLEPPLRGETVVGVDPGLESGCKMAVVSPWGVYVHHEIVRVDNDYNCNNAALKIKNILQTYQCTIIALGNGTGCRKFEDLLLEKIKLGYFKPINVRYKIVAESGVSWYSVTPDAKREYPNLPPSIIGAITIARRLQDPLSELVKVDPKRLQVGMYMKDIDENLVKNAFDEVAVECVSFCGVDVNVASFDLLSKVSGLGPELADLIIEKRTKDGPFTSRSELKNINGLGWKEFEQCAGFIKIMPSTRRMQGISQNEKNKNQKIDVPLDEYDPLDSTVIHPESYSLAEQFLDLIHSNKQEICKPTIFDKINAYLSEHTVEHTAQLCKTNVANMKLIIDSLKQELDYDFRSNFQQIYLPEIQYFFELKRGNFLKGRVMNVTPMGAFVDCGIANGINAYVPAYESERHKIVTNQIVLVKIISIDKHRQRFRVTIVKVIS